MLFLIKLIYINKNLEKNIIKEKIIRCEIFGENDIYWKNKIIKKLKGFFSLKVVIIKIK